MPHIHLLKQTDRETPYALAPAPQSVFAERLDEHKKWFLPLVSVNLNLINSDWNSLVHFVYNEADTEDTSIVSFDYAQGKYTYTGDTDFENSVEDYDVNQGFVKYVQIEVPEDMSTWGQAIKQQIQEIEPDEDAMIDYLRAAYIGSQPMGLDEIPQNPDGEPMTFVGQIRADSFSDDAEEIDLYLFYCHNHQLITQVSQPVG